ncbi:DUF5700 domain-containing putative Zn-dependent protease [Rufibacter sediminis]|uniref:DUF2268 domain-containing protein n=1 Tax=Rufibacter sediminis TaxID=2762756 RepID=A0ABR6VT55_9BACT|nr:DUF5700 domain-containing putative Zn-dependent protease [Rufibacter sediminis]MBC3540357.1 hypothetical protein [Rufibacter sediminis]
MNLRTALFLFLAYVGTLSFCGAQTVNTQAADRYWQITQALRQNQPLTDATWKEFLELQGNKVYIKGVFDSVSLKNYRRAIEVNYMPQHDSLLQAKLKAQSWYYVLVNDYKRNEEAQKEYLRQTSQNPAYLQSMYTLAYEYLPQRAHTKVQDLKLYYNALGNDATSRKEGIFFSLNSATNWSKSKAGILEAHEIHHQIRPKKDFGDVAEEDAALLWTLGSIQNEGTADLIDKKVFLQAGGQDSIGMHQWLLANAPGTIQKLDSTIQTMAAKGPQANAPHKFYQRLMNGTAGHQPGFLMALVIERNGYLRQMNETIDDPFAFVHLYQKAAKKEKGRVPMFSKASLTYLKKLEKKYTAQPSARNLSARR